MTPSHTRVTALSSDGGSFWDGTAWLQVSDDGLWAWAGTRWIPIEQELSADDPLSPAVDVLICFDTTGSMNDLIIPLVRQTSSFVREAADRQLDLHWSLVAFGDLRVPGDRVVRYPFTADTQVFTKALSHMPRFSGGGNIGETSLDALATAASHPAWRSNAARICVLLTDEPPRGLRISLEDAGRLLREQRIILFCVSIKHRSYSWLAQVTGGEWWDIEEPVPFERILERLAHRVMSLASEVWQRLGSPGDH